MTDTLHARALRAAGRMLGKFAHARDSRTVPFAPQRRRAPVRMAAPAAMSMQMRARATVALPQHPHPGRYPHPHPGPATGDRRAHGTSQATFAAAGGGQRLAMEPTPLRSSGFAPVAAAPLPGVSRVTSMASDLAPAARFEPRRAAFAPVAQHAKPAAPLAAGSLPPAAPQAAETPPQSSAPLDEVRLGRWLADYLGDETRRPARGGTGFDPRLSPAWPGTLQGPWGWGG